MAELSSPQVSVGADPVPTWPMPLPGVDARSVELEEGEGESLVIGPKRGGRWAGTFLTLIAIIPCLVGTGLTYLLLAQNGTRAGRVFAIVGVALTSGFLLLAYLASFSKDTWIRLDRGSNRITTSRRPFGFLRAPRVVETVPIVDLVCVQLIYNGFHQVDTEIGEGEYKTYRTARFHAYQMNLLFGGEHPRRMNLAGHSDWEWMRKSGRRIADLLGVTLVDQLHHD